ncbi:MAG: hypothetical protein U0787_07035 [Polyangia bacterium]
MPLLYYGDEYGEFGGGDPDNRHRLRIDAQLSPKEKQLERMTRLLSGSAKVSLCGLRRVKTVDSPAD